MPIGTPPAPFVEAWRTGSVHWQDPDRRRTRRPHRFSPGSTMKTIRVRRVQLISAGKMSGFVGAFMGLLVGIPVSLIAFLAAGSSTAAAGSAQDALSTAATVGIPAAFVGVGAIIVFPLFYGIASFIGGMIYALIYNFVAGWVGGLVLETD